MSVYNSRYNNFSFPTRDSKSRVRDIPLISEPGDFHAFTGPETDAMHVGYEHGVTMSFYNGNARNMLKRAQARHDIAYFDGVSSQGSRLVFITCTDITTPVIGALVSKLDNFDSENALTYILEDGRAISLYSTNYGYDYNQDIQDLKSIIFEPKLLKRLVDRWMPTADICNLNEITYVGKGGSFTMEIEDKSFHRRLPVRVSPVKNKVYYGSMKGYGSTMLVPPAPTGPTDKEIELAIELRESHNLIELLQGDVESLKRVIATSASRYEEVIAEIKKLL